MNRSASQMMAEMAEMSAKNISCDSINQKLEVARSAGSAKHGQGWMAKGTQPKRYEQKKIGARKFFRKYA